MDVLEVCHEPVLSLVAPFCFSFHTPAALASLGGGGVRDDGVRERGVGCGLHVDRWRQ